MEVSVWFKILELRISLWNLNNRKSIRIPQVSLVGESHILTNGKYVINPEIYHSGGYIIDKFPYITLAINNISTNSLLLKSIDIKILKERKNYTPLIHLWADPDVYMHSDIPQSDNDVEYQGMNYTLQGSKNGNLIIHMLNKSFFERELVVNRVELYDSDGICFFDNIVECEITTDLKNRGLQILIQKGSKLLNGSVKIEKIIVGYQYIEPLNTLGFKYSKKHYTYGIDYPRKLFYDNTRGYYHLSDELGAGGPMIDEIEIEDFVFIPEVGIISRDLGIKYQLNPKNLTKIRLCLKPTFPCFIDADIYINTDEGRFKKRISIEYNFEAPSSNIYF